VSSGSAVFDSGWLTLMLRCGREATSSVGRRQFKTIVDNGLGWKLTAGDLSTLAAAFPSHDGSDSIAYDTFIRRLSDTKALPRIQLTLKQFASVFKRLGGDLTKVFQHKEAVSKAKGVDRVTSVPADSVTGHVTLPQFIEVFTAAGAPFTPSQLRTLALCAVVPQAGDIVMIDTRPIVDAALGKRELSFGMGAVIDKSPAISKGKLHTRAKSEFMPRFKSDAAPSRHGE
jgi:hypothetical protein